MPDVWTPSRSCWTTSAGPPRSSLGQTVAALRACEPMAAATNYVETFDMRRRATMYLTYWTAGDTRNRGREMLVFASAYRDAGVEPPRAEAPDHLPVVLEFAATVNPEVGRRLLTEHRVPIDVLRGALARRRVTLRAHRCGDLRDPADCNRPGSSPGRAPGEGWTTRRIRWAATIYPDCPPKRTAEC